MFMITVSDNMATNMLIDRVGMDKVNATLARARRPAGEAAAEDDSPARERGRTTRTLRRRPRPRRSWRRSRGASCRCPRSDAPQLRALLEIPKGGPIEASVPEGVRVAWKPGDIEGVNTAWGLVDLPGRPYVVVGMVNYSDADEGLRALRRIADAAYGYFHVLARSTPYGARVPLDVDPEVAPEVVRAVSKRRH